MNQLLVYNLEIMHNGQQKFMVSWANEVKLWEPESAKKGNIYIKSESIAYCFINTCGYVSEKDFLAGGGFSSLGRLFF